jgi:hypothetical protein
MTWREDPRFAEPATEFDPSTSSNERLASRFVDDADADHAADRYERGMWDR